MPWARRSEEVVQQVLPLPCHRDGSTQGMRNKQCRWSSSLALSHCSRPFQTGSKEEKERGVQKFRNPPNQASKDEGRNDAEGFLFRMSAFVACTLDTGFRGTHEGKKGKARGRPLNPGRRKIQGDKANARRRGNKRGSVKSAEMKADSILEDVLQRVRRRAPQGREAERGRDKAGGRFFESVPKRGAKHKSCPNLMASHKSLRRAISRPRTSSPLAGTLGRGLGRIRAGRPVDRDVRCVGERRSVRQRF